MTFAAIEKKDVTTLTRAEAEAEIRRLEEEVARLSSTISQQGYRMENLEKQNLELIEARAVQAKSYDALSAERQKDVEVAAKLSRRLSKLRSCIDEILELGNSAEALDSRLSQMAADAALTRVQLLATIRAMLEIAGGCISSNGITKEA